MPQIMVMREYTVLFTSVERAKMEREGFVDREELVPVNDCTAEKCTIDMSGVSLYYRYDDESTMVCVYGSWRRLLVKYVSFKKEHNAVCEMLNDIVKATHAP